MKGKTFSRRAAGAAAIALLSVAIGSAVLPANGRADVAAPKPEPTCYYATNGSKVCVTITPPTPAPTPTPRIVTRIVTKVVTIPVKVPVLETRTVIKTQTVVKRVPIVRVEHDVRVERVAAAPVAKTNAAYPAGGRRLANGFREYPANGQTYDVGCNPYAFCLFLFPKGAKIESRAVQDKAHWDVPFTTYGPDGRALIAVKVTSTEPFAYPGHVPHDIRTQLVVTTDKNKWPYIVSLHTSSAAPADGTKVAFFDASSPIADDLAPGLKRALVAAAPTPTPIPTLPPVAAPCSLEGPTMYFLRGTADFKPTNVFEDTQGRTCIAIPKRVADAPVVLKSANDGDEVINSYPWSAGIFVVGTPDVLILQDGSGKGSHRIYVVKDTRSH